MSSSPVALTPEQRRPLPLRYRVAGLIGAAGALVLIRLPIRVALRAVSFGNRYTPCAASREEAETALRAARVAGRFLPLRFACLESALASALACLMVRRRVEWCVGARMMPYAAHSWIAVDGDPVGEPLSADRPYLLLVRT